jgi:hypothetical protein
MATGTDIKWLYRRDAQPDDGRGRHDKATADDTNPGSDKARKIGCKRPVINNGHGSHQPRLPDSRAERGKQMSDRVVYSGQGIGVLGLLGVLFIGLKLTGVIGWSWWLVLLPFYAGLALLVGVLAVIAIIAFIVMAFAAICEAVSRRKFKAYPRIAE